MKVVQVSETPAMLTPDQAFDFGLIKASSRRAALQFLQSWRLNPFRLKAWLEIVAEIQALAPEDAQYFDEIAAFDLYFRTFITPSIDPADCIGLSEIILEVRGIGQGAFECTGSEVVFMGFGSAVAMEKPLKISLAAQTLQALCQENAIRAALSVASRSLQ
jgi:hypothetical protein